jgi:hypothetical protein
MLKRKKVLNVKEPEKVVEVPVKKLAKKVVSEQEAPKENS